MLHPQSFARSHGRYGRGIGCSSRSKGFLPAADQTLPYMAIQRGLVRRGASLLWFIRFDFDPLFRVLRL